MATIILDALVSCVVLFFAVEGATILIRRLRKKPESPDQTPPLP